MRVLTNNPKLPKGLSGFGIQITEWLPLKRKSSLSVQKRTSRRAFSESRWAIGRPPSPPAHPPSPPEMPFQSPETPWILTSSSAHRESCCACFSMDRGAVLVSRFISQRSPSHRSPTFTCADERAFTLAPPSVCRAAAPPSKSWALLMTDLVQPLNPGRASPGRFFS